MENILEERSPLIAFQNLRDEINKLVSGQISADDLVITSSMGSNYKSKKYKTAAFRDALRTRGKYVSIGERFGFVVVKDSSKYMGDRMRLIEEFKEAPGKWNIDYSYYFGLIAKKNIDQLFYAGYAKYLDPIHDHQQHSLHQNILNGITNNIDISLQDHIPNEVDFKNPIAVYDALIKQYPMKTTMKSLNDAVKWALKKELHKQKKIYKGLHIDKILIKEVTKTMFRSYLKGNFGEVSNDILDTFTVFLVN